MPELPEVETVARQLQDVLPGRVIHGVQVLDEKLAGVLEHQQDLRHAVFTRCFRTGKQVALELQRPEREPRWLLVHLRMTGRLFLRDSLPVELPAHLRLRLLLDRGCLDFVDTRRFGTVDLARTRQELEPAGLEPFSPAFTARRLQESAARSAGPVKAWLLRLTHNECLDWLRRQRHYERHQDLGELELPDPAAAPDAQLSEVQHQQLLQVELAKLSEKHRLAINLRYFEQLPLSEIAQVLECSEGTVKSILFRALSKLRGRVAFQRIEAYV